MNFKNVYLILVVAILSIGWEYTVLSQPDAFTIRCIDDFSEHRWLRRRFERTGTFWNGSPHSQAKQLFLFGEKGKGPTKKGWFMFILHAHTFGYSVLKWIIIQIYFTIVKNCFVYTNHINYINMKYNIFFFFFQNESC